MLGGMFEKRRYGKRMKKAGNQVAIRLLRAESHVPWVLGSECESFWMILKDWPLDFFKSARYEHVSDADAANAVEAMTWWYIATVEQIRTGDEQGAATSADLLIPLRDAARDVVSPDGIALDVDEISYAITSLLIGRMPDMGEGVILLGQDYIIAGHINLLVEYAGIPLATQPPPDETDEDENEDGGDAEGLMIPVEWYYWPDDADKGYQQEMRDWHQACLAGGPNPPIPIRDVNRVVFLQENMPHELRGADVHALMESGVIRIPGQQAVETLIAYAEVGTGTTLSDAERVAFLRRHLEAIGHQSPPPPS